MGASSLKIKRQHNLKVQFDFVQQGFWFWKKIKVIQKEFYDIV